MYPNKYFLHLSYDFLFLILPLILVYVYYKYCLYSNKKKRDAELISRLPTDTIIFNINEEERIYLDFLISHYDFDSYDKFLRQAIKEILREV